MHIFVIADDQVYCNSTYDGYLCWPTTLGGHMSVQSCPDVRFSDATHYAYRLCGLDGKWAGRHSNDTNPNGWTNYTPCFPPVVQSLLYKVYDEDETHAKNKFEIADITRTIEIIGFTLSFISLTISLIILNNYKSLNNIRTRIHKNLFSSMNAQVILRLIIYIDQAIMRRDEGKASYTGVSAIEKMTYLCVATYVLLEYFITVMFMWMLCEGFYLNTIVKNNVLRASSSYKFFCLIGWLMPLMITAAWSAVAGVHYAHANSNLVKAVKAAMVLLPLLGITNILSMFEGPVAGPPWQFAAWSYTSHSLRSFQGAVLAWLYCLGTAEIQAVLKRSYATRMAIFRHRHPRLARCLGLQRKRKIQRFPRHHPGLSTSRHLARLETIELTHVQPSQPQTTVTNEPENTVTELNETTTVE
ncbi:unnamed protein product [Arctia plantaginis]|uniref:PDF receptor n=1 Tax=Arctia plantaginis TaxID=874455 RepID=A0A8S1BKI8_ARCPL|nr:unnamed protein product [Arctia plantaginis]